MKEYSLMFTDLSKYAPSLVSTPRDKMSRFVIGVSNDLVEEHRSMRLHDSMDLSRLMVHAYKKLKRLDSIGRIGSLRGQKLMNGVLPRVGLRFKTSLGLRRELTTLSLTDLKNQQG